MGTDPTQGKLAWWDFCPNEIGGEPLVIKMRWTIHYDRLANLFNNFNDESRYKYFGLHIDENKKGWGCLSNVGIAMRDDDKFGIENNWLVKLKMPTTTNKSVWDIIMGTALSIRRWKRRWLLGWNDHKKSYQNRYQRN